MKTEHPEHEFHAINGVRYVLVAWDLQSKGQNFRRGRKKDIRGGVGMNGKKARQLRKKAFGDLSLRETKYRQEGGHTVCIGARAYYQFLKKGFYREGRHA